MRYEKARLPVDSHPGRIGCSQIAGALGVSNWRDAEVNALLTFRGEPVPEPTEEARKRMWLGAMFEDPIAKFAAMDLDLSVRHDTFAHWRTDLPELICHPDRIIQGGYNGVKRVALEIKTGSAFARDWGDAMTDDLPTQYLLQCIGYVVCGVAEAVLLAAERNHEVTYYWVHPKKETVEAVADAVRRWVDIARNPDYQPMPKSYEEISSEYPFLVRNDVMEAELPLYQKVLEWRDLKAKEKEAKEAADVLAGQIMLEMEGHRTLTFAGEKVATLVEKKAGRSFVKDAAIRKHPELADDPECWKETNRSVYLR